jgi:dolichyl-phosphate beta-glucosyltransferase
VVGSIFAKVARLSLRLPVLDTQCGFKMFRRETAQRIFSAVTETGYLFDLELLALAHHHGDRIVEVPVSWGDVAGSKLELSREWWALLAGLWRLRRRWGSGKFTDHQDN